MPHLGGTLAACWRPPPPLKNGSPKKRPSNSITEPIKKVFNGGRFGKARGRKKNCVVGPHQNYNLAWVPRWGRGVNLSSTPRQRRRFGVYMASGKPLRPFLKGASEGQKVAVSELLPLGPDGIPSCRKKSIYKNSASQLLKDLSSHLKHHRGARALDSPYGLHLCSRSSA